MEGFAKESYEAQEHVVDADAADHITEEPGEQYFNAREGIKTVVRLRRKREGVVWIAGHPHQKLLLYALGELIAQRQSPPPIAELEFLLTHADDWVRDQAWRAVEQHWDNSLSGFLVDELARCDIDSASQRRRLVEIAAAHGLGDPVPDLVAAAGRVPFVRRLELVYDTATTKLDGDKKGDDGVAARRGRAVRLLQSFAADERELAQALVELLTGAEIRATAGALSAPSRGVLAATLKDAAVDLAAPLACLAAGAGMDIDEVAARLLATDDAEDGKAAIQALVISNGAELRAKLQPALKHRRYPVRRRAFQLLAADATTEERTGLIALAADDSADVRLAFAEQMQEARWPEAVDALVKLLRDRRNFASHAGIGTPWSKFSVARAAARALGAYEALPSHAIDALLRRVQADSRDPFVACSALSVLATQDDPRIVPVLLSGLVSSGLNRSPSHRPRAQAAAWALFDRAVSGRSDFLVPEAAAIAERDAALVAGPVLLAFGMQAESARDALLMRLRASRHRDREALVRAAAVAADAVTRMSLDDRERVLLRLARGEAVDSLNPKDRAWSRNGAGHWMSAPASGASLAGSPTLSSSCHSKARSVTSARLSSPSASA